MTDSSENAAREEICRLGASLFTRGLAHGSAGNISMRLDDGWLMTPTNFSMGGLDPARLSRLDASGKLIGGDAPTKESFLHRAIYECRAGARAVVHLHSTHAVAVSVLADVDPANVLPPLTAYHVMRVGTLPLIPYFRPGDMKLADAIREYAGKHHAVLLANHGPIVACDTLDAAAGAIEELEETAKLFLLLQDRRIRPLTEAQIADLKAHFPS